jgi:hypothetical protein
MSRHGAGRRGGSGDGVQLTLKAALPGSGSRCVRVDVSASRKPSSRLGRQLGVNLQPDRPSRSGPQRRNSSIAALPTGDRRVKVVVSVGTRDWSAVSSNRPRAVRRAPGGSVRGVVKAPLTAWDLLKPLDPIDAPSAWDHGLQALADAIRADRPHPIRKAGVPSVASFHRGRRVPEIRTKSVSQPAMTG